VATSAEIAKAFAIAERKGHFRIAERDRETPAAHSRRIYDALRQPRRLLLVPGADHNDVLRGEEVWREIRIER
jgi:fermentation-respiration switch protein FrsA (DUF1100 family)